MSRLASLTTAGALGTVAVMVALVGPSDAAPVRPQSPLCLAVPSGDPGDVAVFNITNTDATGGGYGVLRPSDATPIPSRPAQDQYSAVNFAPGETNPNLTFVEIGSDGEVCYDSDGSRANLILDFVAALPADQVDAGEPTRIVDTRANRPVRPRTPLCVTVPSGEPGQAAIVNITNTDATGGGYGALRPSDAEPIPQRPAADQYSSVNFAPGNPDPNLAVVTIGPDSEICYDSDGATAHVILDFVAMVSAEVIDAGDPRRVRDTRGGQRIAPRSPFCLNVAGADPGDVAIVNVTNTDASSDGYGALRPSNAAPIPERAPENQYSSVNFARGTTNPNLTLVRVGPDGRICYDSDGGAAHVILDLVGLVPGASVIGGDPERVIDTRDPGSPGDPPRPAPNSSFAFLFADAFGVARWDPCQAITYRTDLRLATPDQAATLDDAIRAAELATGLDFVEVGDFQGNPNDVNQNNSGADLFFAVYPPGSAFIGDALGVAGVQIFGFAQAEILTATAAIASDVRGADAYEVWLHEIGHAVGLDHVNDFSQVMAPFNVVNFGAYQLGDLNGLYAVSSVEGCITPSVRSKPTAKPGDDDIRFIVVE